MKSQRLWTESTRLLLFSVTIHDAETLKTNTGQDLENQHGLSNLRPGANHGQRLRTPIQDPRVFSLCPETMLTFYF